MKCLAYNYDGRVYYTAGIRHIDNRLITYIKKKKFLSHFGNMMFYYIGSTQGNKCLISYK